MSEFCTAALKAYLVIPKPNVVIRVDALDRRNGGLCDEAYDELKV